MQSLICLERFRVPPWNMVSWETIFFSGRDIFRGELLNFRGGFICHSWDSFNGDWGAFLSWSISDGFGGFLLERVYFFQTGIGHLSRENLDFPTELVHLSTLLYWGSKTKGRQGWYIYLLHEERFRTPGSSKSRGSYLSPWSLLLHSRQVLTIETHGFYKAGKETKRRCSANLSCPPKMTEWCFQIFFMFTPKIGEDSHFD